MSAKDKCPTAQVVTTQTINIGNGLSINRTTFACPDSSLREASQAPPPPSKQIPTNVVGKRDSIFAAFEKRNAVECRNPAPECQCGQDCEFLHILSSLLSPVVAFFRAHIPTLAFITHAMLLATNTPVCLRHAPVLF